MKYLLIALANTAVLGSARLFGRQGNRREVDWKPELAADEAIGRLEAVEDERTSQILCRVSGSDGSRIATVRLQPASNTRSLVFDDDVMGVETRVQCVGSVDPGCLAIKPRGIANKVDECPVCSCKVNVNRLYGTYAEGMAKEVDQRCINHKNRRDDSSPNMPFRVLLLGLGGGELATHIARGCEGNSEEGSRPEVVAVELDSRLPALALRYFGMPSSVKVIVGDALPEAISLRRSIEANSLLADSIRFDMVLVDCFSTGGVTPEHCRSSTFIETLRPLLRGGGTVLQHLWHNDVQHPEVAGEFGDTVSLYRKVFQCQGCTVSVQDLHGVDDLVVASVPPTLDA
eukprot:TRINITY_DN3897_c0_g1_i1.p1 TRINITY_DN3897_c0_g1~~TRINITY_DN3897_c0_g1_i1.p1  ORF type:complete len:344 (-),score=49.74 TRINITY_DN3897_c0_g1_i1:109-1140(-)